MVTPPSCSGLNVEVLVDGQPLQEYDDVDGGPVAPNTVTKYIEAQSNAYFAVRVKIDHDFPFPASDLSLKTTVDQQYTATRFMDADNIFSPSGKIVTGRKVRIGHGTDALYRFRFKALDFVEADDIQVEDHEKMKLDGVGTISVKLQFIRSRRQYQPMIRQVRSNEFGQISEKAVKGQAKSHYVSLGRPVPIKASWAHGDYIGSGPFVTVNFKYRSLAALRSLHIIAREPTPLPLEERPIEELTPDQLLQALRGYKERDAAALKIKKEAGSKRARSSTVEVDSDDEVEIVEAPRRKRRRGDGNEVVVLD